MEIKIDINNATETMLFWLEELLLTEIDDAKGTAENEKVFARGSFDEEEEWMHSENAKENLQYAEMLERTLAELQKIMSKDR